MRILVTGGSGHVGGAIVRELVTRGHEVVALGRRAHAGFPHEVPLIALTLGDPDFPLQARTQIAPCEAVVHAAARIDAPKVPGDLGRINCLGTDQVVALAQEWHARRIIYISSIAVEGLPAVLPMTESHPLAPSTPYAASKLYGECAIEASGIPAVSLRITSPVGPGLRRRRIFSIFVERAIKGESIVVGGQGGRRQNYVDVRDIAGAVAILLGTEDSGVFHVAGAESVSNLSLAERCVTALGSASTVACDGIPDPQEDLTWEVSIERAREAFGFSPRFPLEDSIRDLAREVE